MHFFHPPPPPSCGDGIKPLLSLFDFQHSPITVGLQPIIVPLQKDGLPGPTHSWATLKSHGHPILQGLSISETSAARTDLTF